MRDSLRDRLRDRVSACLAAGFVLVQAIVPIVQLRRPGPQILGWQMYALPNPVETVTLHLPGGRVDSATVTHALRGMRMAVRPDRHFGRRVCARRPEADSVTVYVADLSPATRTTRCR